MSDIIVELPIPLRSFCDGQEEIEMEASTIRDVVQNIVDKYPDSISRLLDEGGDLSRWINVLVNDEDIRFLDDLDTELEDGDRVYLYLAVVGG